MRTIVVRKAEPGTIKKKQAQMPRGKPVRTGDRLNITQRPTAWVTNSKAKSTACLRGSSIVTSPIVAGSYVTSSSSRFRRLCDEIRRYHSLARFWAIPRLSDGEGWPLICFSTAMHNLAVSFVIRGDSSHEFSGTTWHRPASPRLYAMLARATRRTNLKNLLPMQTPSNFAILRIFRYTENAARLRNHVPPTPLSDRAGEGA